MANINVHKGEVFVSGGNTQTAGEPFNVEFRLKNREVTPPSRFSSKESDCDLPQQAVMGHRARAEIEINGTADDGGTVDRTVDLGEFCIPTTSRKPVNKGIEIMDPGSYTITARAVPLPETGPGSNPPDSSSVSITVKKPGETGGEPSGSSGSGKGSLFDGGNGSNRSSGSGSNTTAALNLVNTVLQNPVKSGIGVLVLGYSFNQLQSAGEEEQQ